MAAIVFVDTRPKKKNFLFLMLTRVLWKQKENTTTLGNENWENNEKKKSKKKNNLRRAIKLSGIIVYCCLKKQVLESFVYCFRQEFQNF